MRSIKINPKFVDPYMGYSNRQTYELAMALRDQKDWPSVFARKRDALPAVQQAAIRWGRKANPAVGQMPIESYDWEVLTDAWGKLLPRQAAKRGGLGRPMERRPVFGAVERISEEFISPVCRVGKLAACAVVESRNGDDGVADERRTLVVDGEEVAFFHPSSGLLACYADMDSNYSVFLFFVRLSVIANTGLQIDRGARSASAIVCGLEGEEKGRCIAVSFARILPDGPVRTWFSEGAALKAWTSCVEMPWTVADEIMRADLGLGRFGIKETGIVEGKEK